MKQITAIVCAIGLTSCGGSIAAQARGRLRAAVQFTGAEFIVVNESTHEWRDASFRLNRGLLAYGYEWRAGHVPRGATVTAEVLQFAAPDGTRFNLFTAAPRTFEIRARVNGVFSVKRVRFN